MKNTIFRWCSLLASSICDSVYLSVGLFVVQGIPKKMHHKEFGHIFHRSQKYILGKSSNEKNGNSLVFGQRRGTSSPPLLRFGRFPVFSLKFVIVLKRSKCSETWKKSIHFFTNYDPPSPLSPTSDTLLLRIFVSMKGNLMSLLKVVLLNYNEWLCCWISHANYGTPS